MIFLKVFIASGLLCLAGQILIVNTKIGVARLFTAAIVVGIILSATGIIDHLTGFGFAGVIISIISAGEALYRGFLSAMHGDGSALISFAILIIGIFLTAIVFGIIKKVPAEKQER
jgi:hypothetical protein